MSDLGTVESYHDTVRELADGIENSDTDAPRSEQIANSVAGCYWVNYTGGAIETLYWSEGDFSDWDVFAPRPISDASWDELVRCMARSAMTSDVVRELETGQLREAHTAVTGRSD